jgi:hypothetical protein
MKEVSTVTYPAGAHAQDESRRVKTKEKTEALVLFTSDFATWKIKIDN